MNSVPYKGDPVSRLTALMETHFNEEELRLLCMGLRNSVPAFAGKTLENFGETKSEQVIGIVEFAEAKKALPDLIAKVGRRLTTIAETQAEIAEILADLKSLPTVPAPPTPSITTPSTPTISTAPPVTPPAPQTAAKKMPLDFVGAMVLLLAFFIIIDLAWIFPRLNQDVTRHKSVYLDDAHHHLGDNIYNQEYMERVAQEGDQIVELAAEGIAYTTHFNWRDVLTSMSISDSDEVKNVYLSITLNHLKPRQTAPAEVVLNGRFQAFLNDYIDKEHFKREAVTVPIDRTHFLLGENELIITTGYDSVDGDYEDYEFNALGLRVDYPGTSTNWPAAVAITLFQLALVCVIIFLRFRV